MRSIVSGENGGRPRLPSGKCGDTKATRSAHGTTFSISSRNSRRRVRLDVCPKPRLCCFMDRIVSVLQADAKHGVGRLMQTFLSDGLLSIEISLTEGKYLILLRT